MFRVLHAGLHEVVIGPPGEVGGTDRRFGDRPEAESYLRILADQPDERDSLREVVVAMGGTIMLTDEGVMHQAAEMLADGRLGVREAARLPPGILYRDGASWLGPISPTLPSDRPAISEILRIYTVPADTMVRFTPMGLLAMIDAETFTRNMTATEARLLTGLGLMNMNEFKTIADLAFSLSEETYPDAAVPAWVTDADDRAAWNGNDGHRDALRHSLWNAMMAQTFGNSFAESFGTAHEGVPGNLAMPARLSMDLYNNEQGRRVTRANPRATRRQLRDLLRTEIEQGNLVVVDRTGQLTWSNLVNRYEHGVAPTLPTPAVPAP